MNLTIIDMIALVPMSILLSIALFGIILLIIDKIRGTHYSCDFFGWHNGNDYREDGSTFDGCSYLAKCSKCGKNVMQDSQGNWF
jgi:hypothetical protein